MFDAESLEGVEVVVNGLLAVGVAITIALVTFRLGKRGANNI